MDVQLAFCPFTAVGGKIHKILITKHKMTTSQSNSIAASCTDSLELPNWEELLKESRVMRLDGETCWKTRFSASFPAWKEQLLLYIGIICQGSEVNDRQATIPEEQRKKLALDTRLALRFALSVLSFDDEELRREIQSEAVMGCQWHIPLASILSQQKGDSKCRIMAARIISNLVTHNKSTSIEILSAIPLSPSKEVINSRILDNMTEVQNPVKRDDVSCEPNWVDMVLYAAWKGNREAVAAIVAALHNAICSLDLDDNTQESFVLNTASDSTLVSTILRHFISVEDIRKSFQDDETKEATLDPATQWIQLLLSKLSRLGKLPEMYVASGSHKLSCIVPEQVVLLHCLVKEVTGAVTQPGNDNETFNPLGGEAGWEKGLSRSHTFLAELFTDLHKSLLPAVSNASHNNTDAMNDESDMQLMKSASLAVLDILGASMGVENQATGHLRQHLGRATKLIQNAGQVLGSLVDLLSKRSFGCTSRELNLSNEEQQILTSLVRLLGNLCFRCRYNQDLIRKTDIGNAVGNKQEATDGGTHQRSILHVLLSCTSFGHACFTLREWTIVAIRNILDNNALNQEEVARLEAQEPVATAELKNAGVRVKMDRGGKVSLAVLDEADEENGTSH